MTTYQPIFNNENISKTVWDNDIHNLQNGRDTVAVLRIYGARAISYYFMMTKIPKNSNGKYK